MTDGINGGDDGTNGQIYSATSDRRGRMKGQMGPKEVTDGTKRSET